MQDFGIRLRWGCSGSFPHVTYLSMPRLRGPSISMYIHRHAVGDAGARKAASIARFGRWPLFAVETFRRRAMVVFPVPAGPVNKYACVMRPRSARSSRACARHAFVRRRRQATVDAIPIQQMYATVISSRGLDSNFRQWDDRFLQPFPPIPAFVGGRDIDDTTKKSRRNTHRPYKNEPCTRRRLASPDVTPAVNSDRAPSRHTNTFAYRCFLPDLTGFTKAAAQDPIVNATYSGQAPRNEALGGEFDPAVADCGYRAPSPPL